MTITENRPEVPETAPAVEAPARRPVQVPTGLAGWVMTIDHKRIGRMYVAVSSLAVLGALVIGGLLAVERVDAGGAQILPLDSVLQLLSLYRYGLVFLGVLPMLLGLAIAIVPLQVGAPRIAFPRAAAMSFWGWLIGGLLVVLAYALNGGPGGGDSEAVDLFLVALGLVVASLLLGCVAVVTTTLTMRAPGMTLGRMPILAWGTFVTGTMLLLSLPVLAGDLILLYADHHYGRLIFQGNLGIPAYIDWSVGQPQTYLYALIGLGAIADIVPVMSRIRQPLRFTVLGALGVAAALSFGAYLQPLLAPDATQEFYFVASNLLAVLPVLILFGLWGLAMKRGKPRFTSPLFFALGAGLMALAGAAAGAVASIEGFDLLGTQFELGQFNYVLLAGLLAAGGALVFWGPKLWGLRLPGRPARALALLGVLGVILIALPDLVLGFMEQPLGQVNFAVDPEGLAKLLNGVSFVGYLVLLVAVLAMTALAVRFFGGKGEQVDSDPWEAQTLEWATSSPPSADDVKAGWPGEVSSPEPLLDRRELDRREVEA